MVLYGSVRPSEALQPSRQGLTSERSLSPLGWIIWREGPRESLRVIDLVASFCIENPVTDECFRLTLASWVVNSNVNVLDAGVNLLNRLTFVVVHDASLAPIGELFEILNGHLNCVDDQRLSYVLSCDYCHVEKEPFFEVYETVF